MVLGQAARRVGYAGMSPSQKRVAFVNLREIRGIKFGTRGPLVYNDLFYGADLEVFAYGQLSLQVVDAERFIRNFLPANTYSYSLDDQSARSMLIAEFLASLIVATNTLSSEVRSRSCLPMLTRFAARSWTRTITRGRGKTALA